MHLSNFHPQKKFGQNFLIDKNITRKILRVASITKEDIVLEIGPGKGILTKELAKIAKEVIAVELDKYLYQNLFKETHDFKNIQLINTDILKFNLKKFIGELNIDCKINIVANIPYRITTPILEYIFKNIELLNNIYLMVQKEFAQRLIAKPDTKDYSSMSCFAQFHTEPKLLFLVRRTCFRPQPKVDSYFIRLKPKPANFWPKDLRPKNKDLLFKITRTAFNQRRKNILNSLGVILDKKKLSQLLSKLNIDWRLRAENLSIQDYIRISNEIGEGR